MISDVCVEETSLRKRAAKSGRHILIVVSVLAGYKPDGQSPRLDVINAADQTGWHRSTPFSAMLPGSSIAERHHLIGHERIAARVVPMCKGVGAWIGI